MNRTALALITAASLALPATSANADIIVFSGTFSGLQEFPPNASPGTGLVTVTVDDVLNTMTVDAAWANLLAPTTVAHIHCCAPLGAGAGVATSVPTFPGFPAGVQSGTYNATFDMTLASSFNPAFVTAQGGTTASAFNALLNGMLTSNAYFNIHTSQFPGGEIRAQLSPVPEPSTWAMLLFGFAAVGLTFRRARRKVAAIA
jgi:CHRD domain/PEP-CTERM motif